MISHKNFVAFDIAELPNEFEFEFCNFSRYQPDLSGAQAKGVRLWPGDDRPRTFRNCNLTNCEPPPGSTLIDCNASVIERDVPDVTETLTIDGEVVDTIQKYNYTFHARYIDGQYVRDGLPLTFPQD